MSDDSLKVQSVTAGSVTAEHSELPVPEALVAATQSDQEHNSIRPALIPFACFRADDMLFEFESSFVRPGIRTELKSLKKLIDDHTLPDEEGKPAHKPALTVFGHADPTGSDDFNKALSGRRAQAIYGMLTRKTDLWEELFNNPADKWGKPALGTMLDAVSAASGPPSAAGGAPASSGTPGAGPPGGGSDSSAEKEREKQINKLQSNSGERKKLYKSYMDAVCVFDVFRLESADQARLQSQGVAIADRLTGLLGQEFGSEDEFLDEVRKVAEAGELAQDQDALLREAAKTKPFVVEPEDFLASGKDKGGKGDFQGCGEFNPKFLQSQQDIDEFKSVPDSSPEKPLAKAARDEANEPNRRVLIFLFRPGIHISPDVWPCPRAKEGVEGCKKRFWSDGEKRRSEHLPDKPRTFDATKDTFACRFYDRMSNKSPCEQILEIFRIRLFDRQAQPLPSAPFVHNAGGKPQVGRVGADAFITIRYIVVPTTVNVKWSRPQPGESQGSPLPTPTDKFEFELDVAIDIPEDNQDQAAMTRLRNMGYVKDPDHDDPILAFQRDYKPRFGDIEIDGTLNAATKIAIKKVHDACDPVLKNQN